MIGLNANLIQSVTFDILNLPVKRVNVKMANQKLRQKIGIQMTGVKEDVTKIFEQRPNNRSAVNVTRSKIIYLFTYIEKQPNFLR